ncbi:MAG: hypothetical protein PSY14_05610 [bacterium]|nr:hypothetical protein [bacterium]
MSENTAKVVDFEVFRSSRRAQAPALAAVPMMQCEATTTPAPVSAQTPLVWPVYWVYFPAVYGF